ncbi:MAG: uracil-DNA glycosylase family protein, partial [Mesorhizobium sp.]
MCQRAALASGDLQPAERRRLRMSPRHERELENFAARVRACRICVEN